MRKFTTCRKLSLLTLGFALAGAPWMSGCAAMISIGNPAAAVRVAEGAGLGVVVRRAEAAVETATEVDRLLIITPVGGAANWPDRLKITKAKAQEMLAVTSKSGLYAGQEADVMEVEVWARLLPELKADEGKHPSLLAQVSPALADDYADIIAKYKAYVTEREKVTAAEVKLEQEEKALSEQKKELSEADKTSREAEIEKLDKAADEAETIFDDAKKAFVDKAKAAAAQVDPAVRNETGPILTFLREAVADADKANGAAMAGYPIAATGLIGDTQTQTSIFLADVVEEESGKRPTMKGVQPSVEFDGFTPTIGINGLTSEHLGKLGVGDVTSKTISRTTDWVGKATTLMVWAPSTSTALSYQADVLEAILDAYEQAGWTRPEEIDVDPLEVEAPEE